MEKSKTPKQYIDNLKPGTSTTIVQYISPTAKSTVAIIGRLSNEYFVAKNYFAFVSFLTCCTMMDRYNKKGQNKGTIYEIFKFKTKAGAVKKLDAIFAEIIKPSQKLI